MFGTLSPGGRVIEKEGRLLRAWTTGCVWNPGAGWRDVGGGGGISGEFFQKYMAVWLQSKTQQHSLDKYEQSALCHSELNMRGRGWGWGGGGVGRKRVKDCTNNKKANAYILGRRDVVDIGPGRQRHGWAHWTEKRGHSRSIMHIGQDERERERDRERWPQSYTYIKKIEI